MPLTVLRDGAAPLILTNETVFNRLPDEVDVIALLGAIRTGQPVPVTFRDGSQVFLTTLDPQLRLGPPAQPALMLPAPLQDLETRVFELECQILVPLDATVRCSAPNKHAAEALVTEVFAGARSQHRDFEVVVNRDDVAETFYRLERGFRRGAAAELGVHTVLINRTMER